MNANRTLLISAAILAAAGALVALIYLTEPAVEREAAVKRTAMLVEVTAPEQGSFQPTLVTLGQVRASQDIQLEPRVSGRVIEITDAFVPGRVVSAGEVLVRLDPADARNALAQRRSALRQAEAALSLEKGRQVVARVERDQISGALSADQESLILREPQLASAEASVEAARAAVRQAELELARAAVTAPFDALVVDRAASVGAEVSPGEALGQLIGVDRFWVELTLPVRQLKHLPAPGSALDAPVQIRDRAAWAPDEARAGRLDGVVRQLDAQTRLARLLAVIDDPLALSDQTTGPPLMAGAWVEVQVPTAALDDVVRIPRGLLRKGDTVWTLDDGELRILDVTVVLEDATHAYLSGGLPADAAVVITDLATVRDGAPLRTASEAP